MSNTAQDVLRIAASQLGYYSPDMDSKYGDWYAEYTGESWYGGKWIAWCAMFVSWVFNQAGAKCVGLPGAYTPTMSNKALVEGKVVNKYSAKPGDVVYFTWGNGGDYIDHVGIVEKNNGSYIQTIEGNTSNAVMRKTRSWDCVGYIVRPDYDDDEVKPIVMPTKQGAGAIYRLRNPMNGQHMFTNSYEETVNLVTKAHWESEGLAWYSPTDTYVYRLYNMTTGSHMWTTSKAEADSLVRNGWKSEGSDFSSISKEKSKPVYRLYNKYDGEHMFTVSSTERDGLRELGWIDEGIAFNAVDK